MFSASHYGVSWGFMKFREKNSDSNPCHMYIYKLYRTLDAPPDSFSACAGDIQAVPTDSGAESRGLSCEIGGNSINLFPLGGRSHEVRKRSLRCVIACKQVSGYGG